MNKKLLRKKLALMLANLKKKRKYYCELEYLEATGTQYINTGLLSTANSKVDCVFGFSSMESGGAENCAVFGGRSGTTNNTFTLFKLASGNPQYFRFDYNGQLTVATASQMAWNTTSKYRFQYTGVQAIATNVTTGESVMTTRAPSSSFTPAPICLFCVNHISNPSTFNPTQFMKGRIYRYWYTDGTNTIDLIPVLDWDMTPCMYDKVSGQLFYNQGTGDFVAGREIHPVDYLESTGTQYIDTGIIGDATTKWVVEGALLGSSDAFRVYMGQTYENSTTAKNRFTFGYDSNINMWYCGLGDKNHSSLGASDTNNHIFIVDAANKKFWVDNTSYNTNWTSFKNPSTILSGIGLFGRLMADTGNVIPYISAKIKLSQIYKDDVLVRDFIPCIDQNGTAFMFDRVSHTIYDNAGTDAFKYPARELEYLESTGTQYINTGYTGNSATRVIIGASSSLTSSNIPLFGARDTNGYYNSFSIWQNTGSNGMRFDYTDTTANVTYSHTWLTTGVNIIEKNGRYNYVNGVQVTSNNEKTFSCNNPFYLMAINTSGIAVTGFIGSVSFCKIYENNTLVRDFVPVYKDGVLGMLDKVNNVFYSNNGTGTFTTGKIVEPEYE